MLSFYIMSKSAKAVVKPLEGCDNFECLDDNRCSPYLLVLDELGLAHGVVEGLVAELLLALDDGVDVGRRVLVVHRGSDLALLRRNKVLEEGGGSIQVLELYKTV